jgi:hypothetical protein
MAKLLMIVSSARTIRLADGSDHPTGYGVHRSDRHGGRERAEPGRADDLPRTDRRRIG